MIPLRLDALRRVLVVGAHSDDVEIGCGGTLLRIAQASPGCAFTWLVLTGGPDRRAEARASAEAFFPDGRLPDLETLGLRDGFTPYDGAVAAKEALARLRDEVAPDLVLTHRRDDLHQDHRLAADLVQQTFRAHLVLEYEVPKYDGDMGAPNAYVPIDDGVARRKVDHLMAHFASQRSKHWFTEDLFLGLMRLRGIESGSAEPYAEAFFLRKAVLLPTGG